MASFDRVNHDKLVGQIAKRVEDKRLLKLIRAFLNAGVMENGLATLRFGMLALTASIVQNGRKAVGTDDIDLK